MGIFLFTLYHTGNAQTQELTRLMEKRIGLEKNKEQLNVRAIQFSVKNGEDSSRVLFIRSLLAGQIDTLVQIKRVEDSLKKSREALRLLILEKGKLEGEKTALDKKAKPAGTEVNTDSLQKELDRIITETRDIGEKNNVVNAELDARKKYTAELRQITQPFEPHYERNVQLTIFILEGFDKRVLSVTRYDDFRQEPLDSLIQTEINYISRFSKKNETAATIKQVIEYYRTGYNLIIDARAIFSKSYKRKAVIDFLDKYQGVPLFDGYTEKQKNILDDYYEKVSDYCGIINDEYAIVLDAEKLQISGKKAEALKLLKRESDFLSAGFLYLQEQLKAAIEYLEKNGKEAVSLQSSIKQIKCED